MENYLETIYLLEKEHGHAHIKDIAGSIKIKMPSVTQALKKLKEEKLLEWEHYEPAGLTKKGTVLAERIFFRHKTIRDFLDLVLGVDKDSAEEDACKIEHIISKKTFKKLQMFMKDKKRSGIKKDLDGYHKYKAGTKPDK